MRILLITETLHAGGAETFILRLCRGLNKAGHVCEILNLNPDIENKALLSGFRDLTIHRVRLPLLKWVKKADSLFLKAGLDFSLQTRLSLQWIKQNLLGKYDVYHTHLIKVDYLFSLLKERMPGLKIISTVHGDYSDFYFKAQQGQPIRWLHLEDKLRVIQKQVNKWVVISDEQQAFFRNTLQVPADRVVKVYNGYEASLPVKEGKVAERPFVIGMVARGVRLKGWDLLLEAFERMPADCQLRLVGTGEYLEKLEKQYQGQQRIVFAGFHPNPVEEIMGFDVFVLPSLFPYESLPTVIIEALYCGKPVIATRVGEIPSMITDPETGQQAGFLLDFDGKQISVDQLYGYLIAYYQDRKLLLAHSQVALKAFSTFNMPGCVTAYEALYRA